MNIVDINNIVKINHIILYRLINNKIIKQILNVKLFSINDIKYISLFDKSIQGILII